MADNIPITAGAGTSVATDDVAGVHYQIFKQAFGALDSATLVSPTNPLPIARVDTTSSGTIAAAAQTVALALNGKSGAAIQITGTWVGTLQFEGTLDGTTWAAINGVFAGTSTPGTTITANGLVRLTPSGLSQIRINATAWTSGSATILMRASDAAGGTFLNQSLTAGTNSIGTVQQAALTKGTQGATGVTTQDLKDAGRVIFSAATVIGGVTAVTAEALLTMVATRDGVAAATATTQAVTASKRLRITGISVGMISTGAAVLSMRFAIRMNPSGAVTATSPILRIIPVPSGAALAQAGGYAGIEFIDGIEFSGTHQFGITQVGSAATGTCWVSVSGFEY